jgi:hypothetical protein
MAQLTDKEKKLLALALDSAVQPGEMVNAAVKLIEAWRIRDLRPEDFEPRVIRGPMAERKAQVKNSRPDYGLCTWPWPKNKDGPYRGKLFKEIPPDYLKNQLEWIRSDPDRANRFAKLATEIELFLAQ